MLSLASLQFYTYLGQEIPCLQLYFATFIIVLGISIPIIALVETELIS